MWAWPWCRDFSDVVAVHLVSPLISWKWYPLHTGLFPRLHPPFHRSTGTYLFLSFSLSFLFFSLLLSLSASLSMSVSYPRPTLCSPSRLPLAENVPCAAIRSTHERSVVSHVLYGSVKITSYDCVVEDATATASGGGGGGGGRGSARNRTGSSWFGGGFGGGFRGPAAAAQPQQHHHVASLRASAWHSAPHTSRLTPSMANVHELEAGSDGESDVTMTTRHATPRPIKSGSSQRCLSSDRSVHFVEHYLGSTLRRSVRRRLKPSSIIAINCKRSSCKGFWPKNLGRWMESNSCSSFGV